jgi:hypothetical protein
MVITLFYISKKVLLNTNSVGYNIKVSYRAVGIATGYGLHDGGVGVLVPVGARFFSSACRPDRFWSPPTFLSNGYRGLFPRR